MTKATARMTQHFVIDAAEMQNYAMPRMPRRSRHPPRSMKGYFGPVDIVRPVRRNLTWDDDQDWEEQQPPTKNGRFY